MAQIKAYGTDQSRYQGNNGVRGYSRDSFTILQIGGYTPKFGIYNQATYESQVKAFNDLNTHTYIWFEVGGDANNAKLVLDYFMPKIKTPKGSIIALDYEDGASGDMQANTNAILYAMDRIKQAGYTPMYYSYKPYTLAHVDYKRIIAKYPNSLWIASYMDYQVRTEPNFNYFPSMDGIAIWQFTSTYKQGGLDGNVDLTGITKHVHTSNNQYQSPNLVVDGYAGAGTVKALQKSLGGTVNGLIWGQTKYSAKFLPAFTTVSLEGKGSEVVRLLQSKLGVPVDGFAGSATIKALQTKLGVHADGYAGATTVKALQIRLNGGKLW